jgi:hypothetical protein
VTAACSGADERPPPVALASDGSGGSRGSPVPSHGTGGSDDGPAGASGEGSAGTPASGASGEGGADGGKPGGAGAGEDPDAGVELDPAPIPVCTRPLAWEVPTRLALSTPDDDLLESVTPDGLSLAFAAGEHFFVADRSDPDLPFEEPLEIAIDLAFSSVTLSPDGLRLIGARAEGFAEVTRARRGEPFSAVEDEQPFVLLNSAVLGLPTDETALEPVLGPGGDYLLYSFVSPTNEGPRPTIFETEWLGQWGFGQALLGSELLWAAGQARRAPTGVSSDRLTLFYRDDVTAETRAAWRERPDGEFGTYQTLDGLERVAPDGSCDNLYFSALGAGGIELFVARVR